MTAASDALVNLRNIGPRTADWLRRAGLSSAQDICDLGSVAVYERLLEAGHPENLNALWALEGAILERDFLDIARNERERLLTELAAVREWHAIE